MVWFQSESGGLRTRRADGIVGTLQTLSVIITATEKFGKVATLAYLTNENTELWEG